MIYASSWILIKRDVIFFYRKAGGEATINYAKTTAVERVTDTEYTFTVEGDVYNMDYSGGKEEEDFEITFSALDKVKTKKVWYYGDPSFDYVDFSVKIK